MPIVTEANLAEIAAMNAPAVDSAHGGTPGNALSDAQLRDARADWIKAGHDPTRFDAALKADGRELAPRDLALEASRTEFALPANPQPADYKPEWNRDFMAERTPEQRSTLQRDTTAFAAAMQFDPGLGAAVIERIADIGPRLAKMSPEDRQMWVDQQTRDGVQRAGSEDAFKARLESAKAIVAKLAGESDIAKGLLASAVLNDPWLLATLANHAKAVAAFAKRHGDAKAK
jgi:hypothetical protein